MDKIYLLYYQLHITFLGTYHRRIVSSNHLLHRHLRMGHVPLNLCQVARYGHWDGYRLTSRWIRTRRDLQYFSNYIRDLLVPTL